ncbi:MAG: YdeI/OmpD-associated family protein [Firmicutes bacterium]|nr:YdeI/OmpD-associated family protein [Bacillota bacterium]
MNVRNIPRSWLLCRNLKEWHDWLTSHHDIEAEVWLQIKKARSIEIGICLNEAVEEAICFGWIDGKMYSLDADRYIIRMTPRKPGSMWSMINRKRAEALIADERMTEAGMLPIREAQANGHWQAAYTANEKPNVPKDLIAALQADSVADSNFENWSNSQKLQAVVWVEQSRQPKTRAKRINIIVKCAHNKQNLFSLWLYGVKANIS